MAEVKTKNAIKKLGQAVEVAKELELLDTDEYVEKIGTYGDADREWIEKGQEEIKRRRMIAFHGSNFHGK